MNFEKCTFEEIVFKVFGRYKDEKNSYLNTAYTDLAKILLLDVWSIHVLILQSSSKSVEQSANFEKCTCTLRKLHFKFLEDIKMEKNSYLSTTYTNLAERRLKYTCTNPAKFIEICWTECDILLNNLAATAFQKYYFMLISDPIWPDFGATDSIFMGSRQI